jgi:hypothetical protein
MPLRFDKLGKSGAKWFDRALVPHGTLENPNKNINACVVLCASGLDKIKKQKMTLVHLFFFSRFTP